MNFGGIMDQIVHICLKDDWQVAQELGEYQVDSLESEGFIHFSKLEQAVDTANRYYKGRTDLLLLWVDPARLTAELRWETSHGDLYPHLYGPLNLAAVTHVLVFMPDAEGVFRSLPETG
jgi:uncharacterized protein (DUF952 family)